MVSRNSSICIWAWVCRTHSQNRGVVLAFECNFVCVCQLIIILWYPYACVFVCVCLCASAILWIVRAYGILGKQKCLFPLMCTSYSLIRMNFESSLLCDCVAFSLAEFTFVFRNQPNFEACYMSNASHSLFLLYIWRECVRPCVFIDFSLVYILVKWKVVFYF